MKISLSWLKEYIDVALSPVQIAKILTLAGLEVDAVAKISKGFSGVVVAKVLETRKHPEADLLTIATVTDGQDTFQIVCGAPNCRTGMKSALARIGAVLVDDDGKNFKVKKAKLRGVESQGMLCSGKELGISDDAQGIVEFTEHMKQGTDLADVYGDTVFDISLTPNLGHCSSLIGVARELSAATKKPYRLPEVLLEEDSANQASQCITVTVENPKTVPRYACRVIHDVKVGPSPDWMQQRLEAAGMRPVNNIVDITNYVMLELGHPLHAFDADKLEGNTIAVKNASLEKQFATLDGKEHLIVDTDLMICDGAKPVAIAGVMGGLNSEVSEATRAIVLEAAVFDAAAVRKTSKRLGLQTDASKHFERGCDPNVIPLALDRAAMLMKQLAQGKVCAGRVDTNSRIFPKKDIACRLSRINTVLGSHLSVNEVEEIFGRLEIASQWDGNDTFHAHVPTYRNDLREEIDLVEEVARIYGYHNITKPVTYYCSTAIPHHPMYLIEKELRVRLLREGLQEFLTCDLVGPSLLNIVQIPEIPEKGQITILNPTSVEQSVLRTSLMPGLLQVVKYNWDRQVQDIAGFEVGRIHFKEGDQYKEQTAASIILSGKTHPHHWDAESRTADFFDIKGMIENLLSEMGVSDVAFKASHLPPLHPGRQANILVNDLEIGTLGEIHPSVQRRLDVPQRIYFAEVNVKHLLQARAPETKMQPIAIYPGSERDWTLTLDEKTAIDDIFRAVYAVTSKLLESVVLLALYRSEKLGADRKNATFRFFYRDKDKTIAQERVDAEHARIVEGVTRSLRIG